MVKPSTPLPWPEPTFHMAARGPDLWVIPRVGDFISNDNARYARHAANVLPALVEAGIRMRTIRKQRDYDEREYAAAGQTYGWNECAEAERAFDAALAAARGTDPTGGAGP